MILIFSSITLPAVFLLRSELPTLLRELDARKGDYNFEKSDDTRFLITALSDSCSSIIALAIVVLDLSGKRVRNIRMKIPSLAVHILQLVAIISVFQFPARAVIFVTALFSGPSAVFIILLPFVLLARSRSGIKEEHRENSNTNHSNNAVADVAAVMIAYKVGVTLLVILLDYIMSSLNQQSSSDYEDDSVFSKQSYGTLNQ